MDLITDFLLIIGNNKPKLRHRYTCFLKHAPQNAKEYDIPEERSFPNKGVTNKTSAHPRTLAIITFNIPRNGKYSAVMHNPGSRRKTEEEMTDTSQ